MLIFLLILYLMSSDKNRHNISKLSLCKVFLGAGSLFVTS